VDQLRDELTERGAQVTVAACDVAAPEELAALLAGVPATHPLTGVVHAAGILDDGVIESLTPDRLRAVLRPKIDGAWQLHRLTEHLDLGMFVMFSSVSGVLGSAGQGNYAAANTFLDALVQHRHAQGLPAVSLAWGLWDQAGGGMSDGLTRRDLTRVARGGVLPLTARHGLALFDAALELDHPVVAPVRLDLNALRSSGVEPPAVLRGLVHTRRVAGDQELGVDGPGLAERLAGLSAQEQEQFLIDLVHGHVATVLGHTSTVEVEPDRAFKAMGFDSLTAVELRNRLKAATGLRLPAALIFDHPTPAALAGYLRGELVVDEERPAQRVLRQLEAFEAALPGLDSTDAAYAEITSRLQDLAWRVADGAGGTGSGEVADRLQSASADEVLAFIDQEFGNLD
jgi:acyl carrier protein